MKKSFMSKLSYILALALIVCFTSAPKVSAATYSLAGWRLYSLLTYIPHQNFGDTTILHFNYACYEWNSNIGFNLVYRDPTLRHNDNNYPTDDGINRIYRNNYSSGALAQNTIYYSGGKVTSSDININLYYPWSNSGWGIYYDVWSVFLHELGHTIGLDHSTYSSAVMYPSVSAGTEKRSLTSYEKAGLYALFS